MSSSGRGGRRCQLSWSAKSVSRPKRRYDDKFRASAVLMLEAAGYPKQVGALEAVARRLQMPRTTLKGWYDGSHNPPPANVRHEKELDLVQAIKDELQDILPELAKSRGDASYKDLVTAFAILVDKLQLLAGEPTENVQQRIVIERTDRSTLPAHLSRGASDSLGFLPALQRDSVREAVGKNGDGRGTDD